MKLPILLFAVLSILSCGNTPNINTEASPLNLAPGVEQNTEKFYGAKITPDGAISPDALVKQMEGKERINTKLEATINETCQVKGCWMTVDMGNGEEMRVKFKDYGFFVPTEGVSGKTVIMEGEAFTDTISVDHLKHLAEDAGKTAEQIAEITAPEIGLNFEAVGVIIRN